MEFDVDPLFKKTSQKFDEGGASSLLVNSLMVNNHFLFSYFQSWEAILG